MSQSGAVGMSSMTSSPQQPQSQQSQGSASSNNSLPTAPQQPKTADTLDSIAKVKSLTPSLRDSLAVSIAFRPSALLASYAYWQIFSVFTDDIKNCGAAASAQQLYRQRPRQGIRWRQSNSATLRQAHRRVLLDMRSDRDSPEDFYALHTTKYSLAAVFADNGGANARRTLPKQRECTGLSTISDGCASTDCLRQRSARHIGLRC